MRSSAARAFRSEPLSQPKTTKQIFGSTDAINNGIRKAEERLQPIKKLVSVRLPDGRKLAWSGVGAKPWRFVVVDENESVPLMECPRYTKRTALELGHIEQLIVLAHQA
jgi:hypothetical protein